MLLAAPLLALLIAFSSCTNTTTADNQPGVELYTQMSSTTVRPSTTGKQDDQQISSFGLSADSLHIDRIRILVRDVKLHANNRQHDKSDCDLRVGPFLLDIQSGSAKLSAYNPVPTGSYDHVKFEVHQFSKSEVSTFINDTTYGEFVTGSRYSIIVDGKVFENGVEHEFHYKSALTLNLSMQFDSALVLSDKSSTKLVLLVDPDVLFRIGFIVADPRDPNNKSIIDNNIRACFRALRHFRL